jgi:hypothetical protein
MPNGRLIRAHYWLTREIPIPTPQTYPPGATMPPQTYPPDATQPGGGTYPPGATMPPQTYPPYATQPYPGTQCQCDCKCCDENGGGSGGTGTPTQPPAATWPPPVTHPPIMTFTPPPSTTQTPKPGSTTSPTTTASPTTKPPVNPIGSFRVKDKSPMHCTLEWSVVPGLIGDYTLLRDGEEIWKGGTVEYRDETVETCKTYVYKLSVTTAAGTFEKSAIVQIQLDVPSLTAVLEGESDSGDTTNG